MKYGLKQPAIEKIQSVFAAFPEVEKAILYGSRANGNYKPASDIDLTLSGTDLNLTILNKITGQLDDLLLPYKIDLSIFHQITNPDLLGHISQVGQVFYERV
ncbi:MAG: nucleotidyltransferase domain-containing protein [Bacteroidales bacterium]